jgi:hypothetical protein
LRDSQVIDFIDLTGLARRTGRFPQLVDPRSGLIWPIRERFATISPSELPQPQRRGWAARLGVSLSQGSIDLGAYQADDPLQLRETG